MALVEIDTLQRVRDMEYSYNVNGREFTPWFRAGRITTIEQDGQTYLIMASEHQGLGVALIEPNGGLAFVDAYADAFKLLDGYTYESSGLTTVETSTGSFLYLFGNARLNGVNLGEHYALSALAIEPDATLTPIQTIPGSFPAGGGVVSSFGRDPVVVSFDSRDILVAPVDSRSSLDGAAGFNSYAIRDDGSLRFLNYSQTFTYDQEQYDLVGKGKKTFIVAEGSYNIAPLQVLRLNDKGRMKQMFELPTSDSAIYNRIITDIETVEIGKRSFAIVSEVTRGTILVYEIDGKGRLTLVEQETPGRADGWSSSEALEAFEHEGRHYLAAGGYGNGLGVFEISDGGALTEVDEFTFQDSAIRYVYDLEVRDLAGGTPYIFASTATKDEVRSFRFIAEEDAIASGKKRGLGTEEDDQIFGNGGRNVLKGFEGDDLIEGGGGKDRILGGDGEDNLYGGGKQDALRGGEGYDFLFGEGGNDRLFGENGNDVLYGGARKDKLFGEAGNDRLFGDAGNDTLDGGDGLDVLTDGRGEDVLIGGTGSDVFTFVKDRKTDTILDYEDETDKIDLTAWGRGLEFSDLGIAQTGNSVSITYGRETIIVNEADGQISDYELSLGDFVFA